MHPSEHAAKVIESAILEIRDQSVPLYTFALYYDHESDALSVCADTKENSARTVRRVNSYNARHFRRAIVDGDLATARMWHSNVGRSLSLGDFALVNVGRLELQGTIPSSHSLSTSCAPWPRMSRNSAPWRRSPKTLSWPVQELPKKSPMFGLRRATSNSSLNRTRYGKHRKPGPRHIVHHLVPGLRCSSPQAG
jgi:hypothetical protein